MRPRIRTIKPEAFLDEELWDLEDEKKIPIFRAFCGLLCHADREGRFSWRPRALKASILPYWDGDFGKLLDALAEAGFIQAYSVDARVYGLVRTFKRHQAINGKEAQSELPPPPEVETKASSSRDSQADHATPREDASSRVEGNGNGRERNGSEEEEEGNNVPSSDAYAPSNVKNTKPQIGSVDSTCPLNFAIPDADRQELATHYSVELDVMRAAEIEFCAYWTVGGGCGKTRPNWPGKFRDDLKRKAERGLLNAESLKRKEHGPPQPSTSGLDVWEN